MTTRRRKKRRRLNPRFLVLCLALIFLLAGMALWLTRDRGPEAADVAVPDYVEQDYLTVN